MENNAKVKGRTSDYIPEDLKNVAWVNGEWECCIEPQEKFKNVAIINGKGYEVQEGEYISDDFSHTSYVTINGQDYRLVEKAE